MTTICFKDNVIAYDTRTTANNLIVNDKAEKKRIVGDVIFFMAGSLCDQDAFIDGYFNGTPIEDDLDVIAYILDEGQLYLSSIDDKRIWIEKLDMNNVYARGSGGNFALTAMDMGCSAKEAVKMAMKRDVCTGGRVKTHIIRQLNEK